MIFIQNLAHSFMASQTFLTAIELDIFNTIGKKTITPQEVAQQTKCSLRGTEMLLNALAGLKLLKKKRENFRNSPIAVRYLVRGSKHFIGDAFLHSYIQYKHWGHLTECVKSGKPLKIQRDYRRFMAGMHYHGKQKAEWIAKAIPVGNAKHLLDVGAGPGTYSIEFLKKYRKVKSTLVDYHEALTWAKKFGKEEGVLDRMDFIEGDFFKVAFGYNYDIILLSNTIHIYSEDENILLLRKIKGALKQGGLLIIHDILLNQNAYSPLHAALFSLNMLIHTEEGKSYTRKELLRWLKETGFKLKRTINIPRGSTLIISEKQ